MPEPPDDAIFRINVGPASFAVHDGRATSAIDQPDTASGTVPADDMARSPIDWAAPAEAAVGDDVLTSGEVVEASPPERRQRRALAALGRDAG